MHDIINDIYYISIRGLFGLFPYIITFGVLMFNFGRVNQKEFGFYLKISGILGIIGYGLSIITISLIYIPIGIFSNLLLPFSYGGSIIIFGCYIFITLHGIKNKDRNLKIFGSLYLIGFILSTLVGIILAILFPLELI